LTTGRLASAPADDGGQQNTTSTLRRRSALKCRQRSSPAPTRWSN